MKEEEKKKAQVFWIRFVLWTLFACILPFIFIVWRFDLFESITKMKIGGWGIIGILIVSIFAIVLVRYVKAGMVKWSMTKQCISGVIAVLIPLGTLLLIINLIENNIAVFKQALAIVFICEAIAIPINPMPEWVYEQSKGKTEDTIDYFFKRYNDTKSNDNTQIEGGNK